MNKEQINKYKKENKDMKDMLLALEKSNGGEAISASGNTERDLQIWRRKYDDLKSKTPKKAEQLAGY